MAYRKKSTYRRAPKKSYAKRSTTKRASRPREQVVKLVLQHQMVMPQQALPVMGQDGQLTLPAPKPKGSKL